MLTEQSAEQRPLLLTFYETGSIILLYMALKRGAQRFHREVAR